MCRTRISPSSTPCCRSRAPLADSGFVNPDDAGDYTAEDVVIRDFDATNMAWPDALSLQLGYAGFGMRFVTGEDEAGDPRQTLEIYRKDAAGQASPLDLELPGRGAELDPARCNVAALSLARDSRSIVNAITVETQQRRVEVSVVLAPGFTPAAGDETAANRGQFLRANLSTASGDVRRKYRYYVADEAGDGHWDASSASWLTGALDLSAIFPATEKGKSSYVRRLRPGSNTLLSRDSKGQPLRAQLALSRDYQGPVPGLWDGSGTWQPIAGGWELLDDRLGILVTVEDPECWPIGDYTGTSPQEPSRTLRGITSQANPSSPEHPLHAPADHRDRGRPDAARRHPRQDGLAHGLHGAPKGRRARPLRPGNDRAPARSTTRVPSRSSFATTRPSPWRTPSSSGPPTSFRPWPAA